jgi:hypothetical protein
VFFIAFHIVNFFIFAVAVLFAARTISKLRNTSATYNVRLLRVVYFSLSAWIIWVFQYLTLLAGPSTFPPSSFFLNIGLALGVTHNALWATAVLSLLLERFSRNKLILALLITFSIVIALLAQTTVLSSVLFTQIDAVSAATIFTAFALLSINEWHLNKMAAAVFAVHGVSQWIWRSLWFIPLADTPIALQLGFPLWRITLLLAWIKLMSTIVAIPQRAQPSYQEVVQDINRLELPDPTVTRLVMISSTVEDLVQERDAVARAISALGLTRFRAETFGSLPHTPRAVCASMAERCDIFILITGERYGFIIEEGISVVEFEFKIAHAQNREKILVYVKDRVKREPQLTEFLKRLQHFDHGYFRSLFKTPEELYEKIQPDIVRLLASQANHPPKKLEH